MTNSSKSKNHISVDYPFPRGGVFPTHLRLPSSYVAHFRGK